MSKSNIKLYSKWGDPHAQAETEAQREIAKRMHPTADETPHGMHPTDIEKFAAHSEHKFPGAVDTSKRMTRSAVEDLLPDGYKVDAPMKIRGQVSFPGAAGSSSGSNGASLFTAQQTYQPEFADASRQNYPIHRRLANSYFRLFYKLDPVIGAVIDMMSDLPWSDFQLSGEGVDGEIKEVMEYALTECKIRSLLPHFVREFFVVGEVVPHCFFDDDKGAWTHLALHNPDQINVVYSPFIKMDTLMEFVPDPKLKEIATSTHPMLQRVRETMPSELISYLQAGENIPLSPVNASFIPKKQHPYDLRGTSIISRLWRTLQYEDSIFAASMTTARRSASPQKVVLLGDPATGTIPGPDEERRIHQLLAQAESDPQSWIVGNYMMKHELWGAPERLMSINTHYDLIERIKLSALGVSKAFISGEQSYSSAAAGLTVFLQRLRALREFFINEWMIPKFFMPMAVINEWIKPSKAQASGGHVRIKRSSLQLTDEHMYIIPKFEWAKSLDPNIDQERIDAMTALEQNLGIKISQQKKYSAIGLDSEEEQKQIVEEIKFMRDLAGDDVQIQAAIGLQMPEAGEGPGGGMLSPGIPGEAFGLPGEGGDMGGGEMGGGDMGGGEEPSLEAPPPLEGEKKEGDSGAKTKSLVKQKPNGTGSTLKHWSAQVIDPVTRVFESFNPEDIAEEEPWLWSLKDKDVIEALRSQDSSELWMAMEQWLIDENYPTEAIRELEDTLVKKGKVRRAELFDDAKLTSVAMELGVNIEDSDAENPLLSK